MRFPTTFATLMLFGSVAGAQNFGGFDMKLNGSGGGGTPQVVGSVLQMTNDDFSSASSAFTTGTFAFSASTAWSTDYTLHYAFNFVPGGFTTGGDGIAFVMQGGGDDALGIGGGDMGYGGISNSLAVSFRSFWQDVLLGQDGNVGSQTIQPFAAPIGLNDGDDFFINVALSYDGADHLTVGYSTSRGDTFTPTSFTIDPSSLGSTVRLGFSAGTGGATQLAEVSDWKVRGLDYTAASPVATPEPSTISLVALGTMFMGVVARRRRA